MHPQLNTLYSKKEKNQVKRVKPNFVIQNKYKFLLFSYFSYFHECLYKFYYLSIIRNYNFEENSTK